MVDKQEIKDLLLEASRRRRAIKQFDPEQKIAREDMDYILEIARLSPSSDGMEGWRFLVLEDPQIKEALKDMSWGAARQLAGASHFVLLLARRDVRYDSELLLDSLAKRKLSPQAHQQALDMYKSFQTQDLKLDTDRALFDWSAKQTYIALANMMTAAALIKIDSCPIEGFNVEKVNALLGQHQLINPEKEGIVTMLALGYRQQDPAWEQTRKASQDIISWF